MILPLQDDLLFLIKKLKYIHFIFVLLLLQVAYSPEMEAFFSGSRDKHINMWRRGTTTGGICEKVNRQFVGHTLVVTGLAVGKAKIIILLCCPQRPTVKT